MKYFPYIPTILLVFGILFASFSGNDKSPFLVLEIAGMNIIFFFVAFILLVLKKSSPKNLFIVAFPTLYSIGVLLLARNGILDSQILLGFR